MPFYSHASIITVNKCFLFDIFDTFYFKGRYLPGFMAILDISDTFYFNILYVFSKA